MRPVGGVDVEYKMQLVKDCDQWTGGSIECGPIQPPASILSEPGTQILD